MAGFKVKCNNATLIFRCLDVYEVPDIVDGIKMRHEFDAQQLHNNLASCEKNVKP